ncbi:MAG: DNA primase [Planctomycetales bacterium]|nr:DNA primase [Planctomycetales bacterium]
MSLSELQDAKEQVRQAIDIVELVGSYLPLRRQGRNYVGLCPWHDDSRPSMQVNPERQTFKCWPCDFGGDIFSFVMRIEGLEFREALEMLAERAGIALAPARRIAEGESQFDRRNLLRAMAWAEQQFHHMLLDSSQAEPARGYLAERGVSIDCIKQFQLGFAPQSWDWLLGRAVEAGFSHEVLQRVGLARRKESGGYYDYFRGRLMFSIRDVRSRAIGFGGRVIPGVSSPDDAKYLNSPETPLFNKSSQLYALDLARDGIAREQGIVIMEGYTDVIMAHQHGITNAVAVLGTALGERHVPVVRRFTDSITLVLDGDEAGQRRTMQILDDLLALFVAHEIDLRILTLPEGCDPCDVIASQGSEVFKQHLSAAVDALEHKISAVTNGLESAPGTHRSAQAVEEILDTLSRAFPAGSGASSSALVREQQVMTRLSRQFGIDEETLLTRLAGKRREQASRGQRSYRVDTPERQSLAQRQPISSWEKELLELLLLHPDQLPRLAEAIRAEDISNESCRRLYARAVQFQRQGQSVSFEKLMLATDEAEDKNLLVECDELGLEKADSDPVLRAKDLLEHLDQRKRQFRQNQQVAVFHQKTLTPQQEDEEISKLFRELSASQEKRHQTGSAPTDG